MASPGTTTTATTESGFKWLVGRWWVWALAIAILFAQPLVRTFIRPAPHAPPQGVGLPAFHLVREDGSPFDPHEVSGRVWVAQFVQPGAPEADGALETMLALQKRLRNMGDSVRLVTLPSDDSGPSTEVMKGLAKAHHANTRVWVFATGDTMDLAHLRAGFGVAGGKTDPRFYLVDARGHLRGAYEALDPLVEDLAVLVNAQ